MKSFAAFLLILFGIIVSMIFSILSLTKGWGLEPKSWAWIIWINLAGQIFAQLIFIAAKGIGKE